MFKKFGLLLTFVLLISGITAYALQLGGTTAVAQSPQVELAPVNRQPETLQEVPAEVKALFADGMTLEEFIELNGGNVPRALEPFVNTSVVVVVEMEQPPLAQVYAEARAKNSPMTAAAQKNYVQQLQAAQEPVIASLQSLGATVISRYTKAYNGLLVKLPANELTAVAKFSGVKAIHRAPVHRPALTASVPLIRADIVSNTLGYDGDGITIGIIDTGIDYTHAALGGSGDPDEYANDDPNVITDTLFPTWKVVGGYDFAGTDYDAGDSTKNVPQPDPDPIDENGHGTHVASTAAGIGVPGKIGPGVAPAAKLYALKIFGADGSTNLATDAIEWAMDPNGDGDISDHLDVINMSLGSSFGPGDIDDEDDPSVVASNNAAAIGIIVVASAGNSGDTSYITGSPAAADAAISVAASTTGYSTRPTINISGTSNVTQTNILYQPPAFSGGTGLFTQTTSAPLKYVGNITGTDELCSTTGLAANALAGSIALIQRGSCAFTDKVNNAAALGAVGAIIFNHSTGGNTWVTMSGDPVNIPAAFITHDDGLNLVPADGQTVVVSAADDVQSLPDPYTPADKIADFSSRGPRGTDSMLKPDITAPGVAIFAAAMGEGVNGVSFSGTSMAAPHVAGVAALMRQAHPNWTVEQIKAAMMNTAVDLTDNSPVPRQGAGRVDAYKAVTADTVAIGDKDLVSLNWGVVPFSTDFYYDTKLITLRNFTSTAKVYTATWYFYTESMTKGVSLSLPVTVSVPANGSASVPVNLTIDATQVPNEFKRTLEEYSGYVVFTNTVVPTDSLRVPFYLQPRPYSQVSDDGTSVTSFPYTSFGWLSLEHTGPISSSLFIYPVYAADTNELDVLDHGDIRYIGMDYGWNSSTYGDIFVPAISSYGAWHTPQPYISEFDMYLDVDEDGTYDLLNFNWNYGAYNGGDSDDVWVIVQVDLQTSDLSLGSPYLIYTDYNASFQEWYLPATWNGLEDITTTANTDFNYQFFGFDVLGNSDASEAGYFDIAKRPFVYLASDDPGPDNRSAAWVPIVNDTGGYLATRPKGVMVVDYNGHPDNQVLYFPLDVTGFTNIFMPLISQQ